MSTSRLQFNVHASLAPDSRLPESPPLTLTSNFAWVVFFCIAALLTVPIGLGWIANLLLN